ncbi:hypothetical protein I350_07310 [Cryptococcus amylolentus CBS 6273]|uniref:Zn(2)-C6 fungal-type domain-containing protein n=1 Tax=Cryptococcus amylolentus CBS 6273 TaxID=1296118 RepID=A0A1E3JEA0_9TREE|nr:hypothetical protein I350_07310 [Cryptococcus amylolentus CBS 6273]
MKRTWEQQPQGDAPWVHLPAHPYAQAYFTPSPLHTSTTYDNAPPQPAHNKKQKTDSKKDSPTKDADSEGDGDDDDDDDEDDPEDDGKPGKGKTANGKGAKGADGKPKQKLTRGSRACIACRKIKMRCIPDDSSAGQGNGICKRCKAGGHECIFEESNRGKRSTRKNEALAAKVSKMEAALKNIGLVLSNVDPSTLNSFNSALRSATDDPDVISMITAHASSGAAQRMTAGQRGAFSGHDHEGGHQPPLSPRLHSLPDNVLSPLGLLAEASLQNDTSKRKLIDSTGAGRSISRPHSAEHLQPPRNGSINLNGASTFRMATSDVRGGGEGHDEDDQFGQHGLGVSSHNYFKPGTGNVSFLPNLPAENRLPELLTIATREEIGELFEIFFDNMGNHVPLVYKEFHTPDLVLQRSQFLCTVICAIAARFYHKKPELHHSLSAYAKRLAFEVPSRGYKSVEVVQAYLLLSLWTLGPEKTFEQDRTWLMLGMAIRMATDLNLHRKSIMSGLDTEEGRARDLEIINRERCWLHCFVLDRSLSAQMGKPYSLKEDYIIRSSCEATWAQQAYSLPSDAALSAYVMLQQIMSRAIDSIYSSTTTVSGLRDDCDYMMIVRSAHEELRRWLTDFSRSMDNGGGTSEWSSRANFYFAYSSLVLYSFGLENALERAKMDISFFLTNVYEAATKVCTVVKEEFMPRGWLPYLPDTNFVMCSYALLSLLKLLKPELRPYHDSEDAIFKLVSEMADVLEECAVDPSHQPAIYAAFIREIVRKTKELRHGGAGTVPSSPGHHGQGHGQGQHAIAAHMTHLAASQAASMAALNEAGSAAAGDDAHGHQDGNVDEQHHFDPSLMGQGANWHHDVLSGHETQFTFIPQGGDMLILPSQAGPSIAPSPTSAFLANPGSSQSNANPGSAPSSSSNMPAAGQSQGGTGTTPHFGTPSANGWAEYMPTFMSSDGFDGWDGSMLLPGFGRGQITLSGGLLHSQYGSGIMTPLHQTPIQSRIGSRAGSRAQSPHHDRH